MDTRAVSDHGVASYDGGKIDTFSKIPNFNVSYLVYSLPATPALVAAYTLNANGFRKLLVNSNL